MHKLTVEDEVHLVDSMIDLYAAAHRFNSSQSDAENSNPAVPDTEMLKAYTHKRLEQCRYRDKPEMRRQIRMVMRYSGPRMLFRHPVLSLQHLIGTIRSKRSRPL